MATRPVSVNIFCGSMDLSFKLKSTGLVASPRTALFHLELRIPDVEDAARVYIEDVLIAETTESLVAVGQVYLLRGALHTVAVEYHESTGPAAVSLAWSCREISSQPIPAHYLYPRGVPLKDSPLHLQLVPSNGSSAP